MALWRRWYVIARFLPIHHCVTLGAFWLGFCITNNLLIGSQETVYKIPIEVSVEDKGIKRPVLVDDSKELEWLYAGVISSYEFLETRAIGCYSTWARHVPRVEFFVGDGDHATLDLPIVKLNGVKDNEYPPQHKAFAMLKHMCAFQNDFLWFLRADDDVYIKLDKLQGLLLSLDPTEQIYLGQPGYGRAADLRRLELNGQAFCMGGPGVIISQTAMQGLCAHVDRCAQEVMTTEEDVELGRCFMKHLGIQCTTALEISHIFYHAYPGHYKGEAFVESFGNDSRVRDAMTLHPAKRYPVMMKLHKLHLQQQLDEATKVFLQRDRNVLEIISKV